MTIRIKQTYFEPLETGRYPARIAEIEESEGQFGPQLEITFELSPDEDGNTRTLRGYASMKFSGKSKLYRWTKAALGGEPIDRSYTFNSEDLIGKKVYITVIEIEGDDGDYNKIEDVSPFTEEPQQTSPPPEYEGDW